MPPLGALRFLYVGVDDYARAQAYYRDVLGAERVWAFDAFDAKVGAFRLGSGDPLVLLADHRPAGTMLPVYEVEDLAETVQALTSRGWSPEGERFGIPNGDCLLFRDGEGNEYAIFEDERPGAMEAAYADAGNPRAIRD